MRLGSTRRVNNSRPFNLALPESDDKIVSSGQSFIAQIGIVRDLSWEMLHPPGPSPTRTMINRASTLWWIPADALAVCYSSIIYIYIYIYL